MLARLHSCLATSWGEVRRFWCLQLQREHGSCNCLPTDDVSGTVRLCLCHCCYSETFYSCHLTSISIAAICTLGCGRVSALVGAASQPNALGMALLSPSMCRSPRECQERRLMGMDSYKINLASNFDRVNRGKCM